MNIQIKIQIFLTIFFLCLIGIYEYKKQSDFIRKKTFQNFMSFSHAFMNNQCALLHLTDTSKKTCINLLDKSKHVNGLKNYYSIQNIHKEFEYHVVSSKELLKKISPGNVVIYLNTVIPSYDKKELVQLSICLKFFGCKQYKELIRYNYIFDGPTYWRDRAILRNYFLIF